MKCVQNLKKGFLLGNQSQVFKKKKERKKYCELLHTPNNILFTNDQFSVSLLMCFRFVNHLSISTNKKYLCIKLR